MKSQGACDKMVLCYLCSVLLLMLSSSVFSQILVPGCFVSTSDGLPMSRQPLYLQSGELSYPKYFAGGSYLIVDTSGYLTLGCPGTTVVGGKQLEQTMCTVGTTFILGLQVTDIMNITCNATAKSSIVQTTRTCGPLGSKVIEVGFQLDKWYKLFETCHDNTAGVTAYATHKVLWLTQIGSQKNSDRPAFKKGLTTIYKGLDPEVLYQKKSQEAMFLNYLGTSQYFNSSNLYLSKGHLAPDADFLLTNWQWATYFYVDTAPQWSSLNSGNWLAVERAVRNYANKSGSDLDVATGTYGILELKDVNGLPKPIYLDPNSKGIPVPRLFWKSIYNPKTDSGIVFLMENDPFDPKVPLCQDLCTLAGWNFTNSQEKGIVYCCRPSDLVTIMPYMQFTQAANLLSNK